MAAVLSGISYAKEPALQTMKMSEKDYNKAAGFSPNADTDSYCYITLLEPYADEDESPKILARGVGDGASKMVIQWNKQTFPVSADNLPQNSPFIWHNAQQNTFVTFDTTEIEETEWSSNLNGYMTILSPNQREIYPATFGCRD